MTLEKPRQSTSNESLSDPVPPLLLLLKSDTPTIPEPVIDFNETLLQAKNSSIKKYPVNKSRMNRVLPTLKARDHIMNMNHQIRTAKSASRAIPLLPSMISTISQKSSQSKLTTLNKTTIFS